MTFFGTHCEKKKGKKVVKMSIPRSFEKKISFYLSTFEYYIKYRYLYLMDRMGVKEDVDIERKS